MFEFLPFIRGEVDDVTGDTLALKGGRIPGQEGCVSEGIKLKLASA